MSISKSKPRGVHGYTDGRGRRCYRIEYVGTDGKRRFKRLGPVNLKEAVEARENLNVAVRRRELIVTGEAPTFRQVREEYVAARTTRERTCESRDSNLRLYASVFECRRINEITKAQILPWLGQLRSAQTGGPLSDGTRAQILFAVSGVFEHAVDAGYIARNPCKDLSKAQKPRQGEGRKRILTQEEETRLLAYCARFPWLRPIVVTALHQALRLGEVIGLQWENIDFANNKLRVCQQLDRHGQLVPTKGTTRNRRDRRDTHPIDLMPAARDALLDMRDAETGFVFRNQYGGKRSPRDVVRAFEKAVRYAGLPTTKDGKPTFHALRHTGLSRLANDPRIPLVYVRDHGGHASLSTTEGYVHRIDSADTTSAAAAAMAGTRVTRADENEGD